jgi:DNA (cytosine-5)-methyltransferase 1
MRERPLLLDLFCGAGGCAVGYHRAGFDVVGVDHKPMPRYPFEFIQGDALEYLAEHGSEYDAIHASPPCQRYSVGTKSIPGRSESHPDLVPQTRELLEAVGKPWVIENVVGAPLRFPLKLCGSMFGLLVERHRLFESSELLLSPGRCRHHLFVGNYPCGRSSGTARAGERSKVVHVYGQGCSRGDRGLWQRAMGINWMTMREMAQAIPPVYTEWIGKQLIRTLEAVNER